jgi:hypothetical protein
MNRFGQGGFFSGGGNVRLVGSFRQSIIQPRLAQTRQQMESPRLAEARRKREEALKHLRSAEDNLDILDATMGPEAALQALEEGRNSLERAQEEYDNVLEEETVR